MKDASSNSPRNGECVSDESVDYEQLGQTLLSQQFELRGAALRGLFMEAAQAVDQDGSLDVEDLRALEDELRRAQFLVEDVREAME